MKTLFKHEKMSSAKELKEEEETKDPQRLQRNSFQLFIIEDIRSK